MRVHITNMQIGCLLLHLAWQLHYITLQSLLVFFHILESTTVIVVYIPAHCQACSYLSGEEEKSEERREEREEG